MGFQTETEVASPRQSVGVHDTFETTTNSSTNTSNHSINKPNKLASIPTSLASTAKNLTKQHQEGLVSDKLSAFKHFPQPMFLIDPQLRLLESNDQGRLAIENRWVGLTRGRLHFSNLKNDEYVIDAVRHLNGIESIGTSTRFALRSLDMVCRSHTISKLSLTSSELVLTIQGDLVSCTDGKMESIARLFSLTASETKVVEMMVNGLKPKEIAYEANISLNTVRSHLRTLYAKMQVRSFNDVLTQVIRLMS